MACCYVNPVWYIKEIIFSLVLSHLFKKLRFGRFVVSYTLYMFLPRVSSRKRRDNDLAWGYVTYLSKFSWS